MKKLLLILLLGMFMISFVSAFEFDNKKSYNENTKTITIKNSLLGIPLDKVAEIELKTPLNFKVPSGYQKVAEFEIRNFENYNNALKQLKLYDTRNNNKEFVRDFDYKYKTYVNVSIDDYENVIIGYTKNKTEIYEKQLVGNHIKQKEVWVKLTSSDFKKNDVLTIGIFTEVKEGDIVEWIPKFFGVEIKEWAIWTEDLNFGLVSYCKLDEITGTNAFDELNLNNGTATNSGVFTTEVTGIINTGADFVNDYFINLGNDASFQISNLTMCLWVNSNDTDSSYGVLLAKDSAYAIGIKDTVASAWDWGGGSPGWRQGSVNIADGEWHFVCDIMTADTTGHWYVDGVADGGTFSQVVDHQSADVKIGGSAGEYPSTTVIDEVAIWNRTLSEAEITQLYNGGIGMSYTNVFGPEITLNSPVDTFNSTNQTINFNGTVTSPNGVINVSLILDGIYNETNTSGINITNYLFTKIITDGDHNWTYESCNIVECTNATIRTFSIDTVLPLVNISSPVGILDFSVLGNNETLNVTFIDTNLDTCWFDYNGTNVTIDGCVSGVLNSTQFLLEEGNTNLTAYVNDTFGNENSNFTSWSYNLTEVSQIYPSTSVESATEIYTTNLSYNSSKFSIITGMLTLNGSQYAGTRTGSGDSAIFTTSAIMPDIDIETNFTAYWTIDLTDISGTIDYNLTSHNVTVSIINMSLCDATLNIPFWNFTILNESNAGEINSTFEGTFTVRQSNSTTTNEFSYADTSGNNSQFDFCISPGTESYTIDTNIKLTKSGYVDTFYNYEEIVVTNATREDNLYMLLTGDSTSFIIHVLDTSGTNVEEAEVRVQRYYPGTGEWLTTEILTTNYVGEAVGHILSEDADYRFKVYQSGVSIYNSSSTKITCAIAPCTVTLTIPITIATGFEEVEDLSSTLTYSSTTNIFTYTYSDSSGDLSFARLYVLRVWPSNSTLVVPCNTTKTTSSGVITCDITGQVNGTYRATAYITRTVAEFLDKRIDGVLGTRIYNSMGNDGVLWAIFVFMAIIMIGMTRPSLAIIFGALGVIVLSLLQIINIGAISIVSLVAIAIILLMRIGRE